MSYDDLSEDELQTLVGELQQKLRKKRGLPTKESVAEFLDPNSPSFMGSGMSFSEFMAANQVERIRASFHQQDRLERRRRLDLVVRMSVAYTEILKQTTFSTAFCTGAIEAIIEGDWLGLKTCRDALTFEGEGDEIKNRYEPLFRDFVQIIDQALALLPKQNESSTRH